MIRKRSLLSAICDVKRKKSNSFQENGSLKAIPTDTSRALRYLSSIFPLEKFQNRLPPIVMRHQIYAFVKCRTEVDKHLNDMCKQGEIRLFKLGNSEDEIAIVYMKDYKQHIERCCQNNTIVGNFMNTVVTVSPDICFAKNILMSNYGIKEGNISELIQQGVLASRDVGCYWLSIPRVGEFVKTFLYGRRATLQYVRRTKYKEILQSELEKRKLPRKALLGILYHVYDIIGSDFVTCLFLLSVKFLSSDMEIEALCTRSVETSMGTVLRLQPELVSSR